MITEITQNGAAFPTKSYKNPPNGYPDKTPNATLPKTKPKVCARVCSSVSNLAAKQSPDTEIKAEAIP